MTPCIAAIIALFETLWINANHGGDAVHNLHAHVSPSYKKEIHVNCLMSHHLHDNQQSCHWRFHYNNFW